MPKKIVIIGGGPGGYVTAIRAAQYGAEVHLVEEKTLGGTCLNEGCIPTKSLLHSSNLFILFKNAYKYGINGENINFDWLKAQKNKDLIVKKLVKGVNGLLASNGVNVHFGKASIKNEHIVEINNGESIVADYIIIATGSIPIVVPFENNNLSDVINSSDALNLKELPRNVCILGGGVIGAEFAHIFSSVGVKVSIIEMLPRILANFDAEISNSVCANLQLQGVEIYTSHKLLRIDKLKDDIVATAMGNESEIKISCDKLIVAVGRKANTSGLNLENMGILQNRGFIATNCNFKTNISNIYAIGDCNGKHMLAHAASAQGQAVVDNIFGKKTGFNPRVIPSCVYVYPEVACLGQTEEQLISGGTDYRVGRFYLAGNGKSLIEGCQQGFIKLLCSTEGKILGAHLIGPRVTDIIAEIALAMQLNIDVKEISNTIHAHPTVSESVVEAALDLQNLRIHWPPNKTN